MPELARDEAAALLADAVSLWRLSPGNADQVIDGTLQELRMQDVLAVDARQGALAAVLHAFERNEFSARELARWAHTNIGHDGDPRCQVFVDLDDMYDTVDYSAYDTEDLDRWTREEADAFLEGRLSPGRTTVWRNP